METELEIRKLRYFIELARTRSFTVAAQKLYISQPMLSKAVQQLEKATNVRLIERTSKKFELTQEGRLFYEKAQKLLDDYQSIVGAFSADSRACEGEVSISIPGVILSLYFPGFLMEFQNSHPGIRINIFEEGSKDALQYVQTDVAHIGIVMLPIEARGLEVTPIVQDRSVLVTSRQHRLSHRKTVHMAELRDEKFIIFNRRFVLNEMILHACNSEGFMPDVIYQSALDSFIVNMVSLNQGITILPRPLMGTYPTERIHIAEIEPVLPWKIALIVKKNRYLSPGVRQMIGAIKAYFGG